MVSQENDMTVVEHQAFNLAQAAIQLDQSRIGERDFGKMAQALEHNLHVWIAIGGLVRSSESRLAANVRDNILKLRDFIADMTMKHGIEIPDTTLNTLININFQISEGLLEGAKARKG